MNNRFRAFVLVSMMILSGVPTLTAETMGTNPKPHSALANWPVLQEMLDAAVAYLGF